MTKLIAAGLLAFTVPPNTTFVVDEKDKRGARVTGFLNSDNELVGWGSRCHGMTREAVWDGQGKCADGVERHVSSDYNGVCKTENGRDVLGRVNYSGGSIIYWVDGKDSSTFNQEAEDFANKVYACIDSE